MEVRTNGGPRSGNLRNVRKTELATGRLGGTARGAKSQGSVSDVQTLRGKRSYHTKKGERRKKRKKKPGSSNKGGKENNEIGWTLIYNGRMEGKKSSTTEKK